MDADEMIIRLPYSHKTVNNAFFALGVFPNGRLEGVMTFGPSMHKSNIQGLESLRSNSRDLSVGAVNAELAFDYLLRLKRLSARRNLASQRKRWEWIRKTVRGTLFSVPARRMVQHTRPSGR
ncbi:hypothetical protein ACVWZM_002976 [Bradyrhizobium sp. USDA 4501]